MKNNPILISWLVKIMLFVLACAIIIPQLVNSGQKDKESTLRQDLMELRQAIDSFENRHGDYPRDLNQLLSKKPPTGLGGQGIQLVKDDFRGPYLDSVPINPLTASKNGWTYNPQTGNVHISSNAVGLDGKRYCDW